MTQLRNSNIKLLLILTFVAGISFHQQNQSPSQQHDTKATSYDQSSDDKPSALPVKLELSETFSIGTQVNLVPVKLEQSETFPKDTTVEFVPVKLEQIKPTPVDTKEAIQPVNLVRNITLNSAEIPYECKERGKCFAHTQTLITHDVTHTGQKPH